MSIYIAHRRKKITPFGAIFSDLELPLTQIVSSACHYLMPNSTR